MIAVSFEQEIYFSMFSSSSLPLALFLALSRSLFLAALSLLSLPSLFLNIILTEALDTTKAYHYS